MKKSEILARLDGYEGRLYDLVTRVTRVRRDAELRLRGTSMATLPNSLICDINRARSNNSTRRKRIAALTDEAVAAADYSADSFLGIEEQIDGFAVACERLENL